jgi:hypothetical protein
MRAEQTKDESPASIRSRDHSSSKWAKKKFRTQLPRAVNVGVNIATRDVIAKTIETLPRLKSSIPIIVNLRYILLSMIFLWNFL